MAVYLYLSMMPESLVASMLPPDEFGRYLAAGTRKRARGQAMFFDLTGSFKSDYFDFSRLKEHCVPHADGEPKHSVYLAIYRVMEHVPIRVIHRLWLVTPTARVLELQRGEMPSEFPGRYHLYQEICPVHPLIASSLDPPKLCRFITDPARPISVPRICFADLELAELADDPRHGRATDLPYDHLDHVRDCFVGLEDDRGKHTKTIDRINPPVFPYRAVRNGFFLGDQQEVLYFPYPKPEELESKHFFWDDRPKK
jgi:hypothetical protein